LADLHQRNSCEREKNSVIQSRTHHLVQQAASRWVGQLIDFGPRNTLLYFKERQTTTLDLGAAAVGGIADLLAGQKVRPRTLFADQEDHTAACSRARILRRKLVELDEEQGIQAGWVARGLICMERHTHAGRCRCRRCELR
jgi:hypothetical protein